MPDKKITQLDELMTPAAEDLLEIVDDPSETPVSKKIRWDKLNLRMFEAVVDSLGNADYSTLGAAIAAGKKNIFQRNGDYIEEASIPVTISALNIVGESMEDTVNTWTGGTTGFNIASGWYHNLENLSLIGHAGMTDAMIKSSQQHLRVNRVYFNTVSGAGGNGVEVTGFYANVLGCHFEGIANACIEGASSMSRILDNYFYGQHTANRMAIKNPGMNSVINGNIFRDWDGTNNYCIYVDAAFKIGRSAIVGNHFDELIKGIYLHHADSDRVVITGNTFNMCKAGGYGIYADVALEEMVVSGNSFDDGLVGVYLNTPTGCTIVGNAFKGRGTADAGSKGIHIAGNTDYNIITANRCKNFEIGVHIDDAAANKNIVTSNNLLGNGAAFTDAGTLTEAANNIVA